METETESELKFFFIAGSVFIVSWIFCIVNYGFLLGLGFGWIPSAILAMLVAFFWPLIVGLIWIAAGVAVILFLQSN